MLNKEQINEPHNCPCILCNELQRWQAEAGRQGGWKLCFREVCFLNNSHQRTKTNLSVAQGTLSGWQEESRSTYWQLLFFR